MFKKLPKNLKIERYVGNLEQFRIYADTSQCRHGAAIYGLVKNRWKLLGAKSRVNASEDPEDKASTPRRELMAALLAVELALEFERYSLDRKQTTFLSDNMAVLAYLRNLKIPLVHFEREKVKKILSSSTQKIISGNMF